MAPKPLDYKIQATYDPKGASAAIKDAQALAKALADAAKGGAPLAQAQNQAAQAAQKLAQAEQKTAQEVAKTAQQQQKLAAEVAKVAQADQRAQAAAQQTAAAADRAAVAALRRAQAEEKAAAASQKSASGASSWGSAIAQSAGKVDQFIGAVQGVAGAFAVVQATKGAYEFAAMGAAAQAARASFDSLAASANTSGQAIVTSLRTAAKGTVSDAAAISAANRALLLIGSDAATKLPPLMEIARASAVALGDTTEHVFDSLVTGISRGSTMLIDNAGITFKAEEAYAAYAAQIGKSADQLTSAEKQQAFLNMTLEKGQVILDQTAGTGDTANDSFQRFAAAAENLKNTLAGALATGLQPMIEGLAGFAQAASDGISVLTSYGDRLAATAAAILESSSSYEEYKAKVDELNAALPLGVPGLEALSAAQYAYAKSLTDTGSSAAEATTQVAGSGEAARVFANALGQAQMQGDEARATLEAVQETVIAVASTSETGAQQIIQLSAAFLNGQISAEDLRTGVESVATSTAAMQAATEAATSAEEESAAMAAYSAGEHQNLQTAVEQARSAVEAATSASLEDAAAKAEAAAEAEVLKMREDELMAAAQAAASGTATLEAAAANLAAQFGISEQQALRLVAALRQVAAAGGVKSTLPGDLNVGSAADATATTRAVIKARQNATNVRGGVATPASKARGGGGGAARESAAQKAGDKLADIEAKTGAKLAAIDQQTADKLVAIDQKQAAERAKIAQALALQIAASYAEMVAQQEADDLDLVGVTDKNEKAKLDAREKAQAEARQRMADLNQETLDLIQNGAVDQADAERDIKEKAIQQREALDQSYYEKQAELAGNPEALAALEQQYQEAVAAQEEATAQELAIAQAKVDAKKQAAEDEKAAVIEAAMAQKDSVVKAAQDQAAAVTGASAAQRDAVIGDLGAMGGAATDWAGSMEAAASRVESAAAAAAAAIASIPSPPSGGGGGGASSGGSSGGGGGATKAAGGGTFVTHGPTTLTVGDNPGGAELVHVTPLSGRGTTSVGGGMARLAGGGSLLSLGAADLAGMDLEAVKAYKEQIEAIKGVLEGLKAIASADVSSAGPLDVGALSSQAAYAKQALDIIRTALVPISEEEAKALKDYADAVDAGIGIIQQAVDLQTALNEAPQLQRAYFAETIQALAGEMRVVIDQVTRVLVPMSIQASTELSTYADGIQASSDVITTALALRAGMVDIVGTRQYFSETIQALAGEMRVVVDQVRAVLVPLTERAAAELSRYHDAVSSAADIVTQALELRKQLADMAGGRQYFAETIQVLVGEMRVVADQTLRQLAPLTESEVAALGRFRDGVGAAIQILSDALNLRKDLDSAENVVAPIDMALITKLANEAQAVTAIVQSRLIPLTQDEADALKRYADAAGSAVSVLRDMIQLRKDAADAGSPIGLAVVTRLADDAQRISTIVQQRLVPTSQEQADGLKAYADAVGAGVSVLRDTAGLGASLFADYQSPTDAQINRVVADSKRITDAFSRAAATMSTEGAQQAQAYADAASSAVQAAREGLLTIQALNDQTFALDPKKLASFESASVAIIGTLGRIGARALTLPPGALAAATQAAGAVRAQSEALTALAAVPFDNAAALAGSFAGVGGGYGGSTTIGDINLTIYQQPGQDAQALARTVVGMVTQQLTTGVNARR